MRSCAFSLTMARNLSTSVTLFRLSMLATVLLHATLQLGMISHASVSHAAHLGSVVWQLQSTQVAARQR